MHKLSNFTGQARHGWESLKPGMSFGNRSHSEGPMSQPPLKRPAMGGNAMAGNSASPGPQPGSHIALSFPVPINTSLAGPEAEEVLFATAGAHARWVHQDDNLPVDQLPVHQQQVKRLLTLCNSISDLTGQRVIAEHKSDFPKPVAGLQRTQLKVPVHAVCLHGEVEAVNKMRAKILNEMPISLV